MRRDEALQAVQGALADMGAVEPDKVVPSAVMGRDLDLDELDLVELVMLLEDSLGITIGDDEIGGDLFGDVGGDEPAPTDGPIPLASQFMRFDTRQRGVSMDSTIDDLVNLVLRKVNG